MTTRLPFGLSAHLGYLFLELPLRDRIRAARSVGFDAVEHPHPFAIPASEMMRFLTDNGLYFAQMAGGVGDPSKGEKGLAALPGRERDFVASFERSVDYAEAIGCSLIHPMAGIPPSSASPESVAETYHANIDAALAMLTNRPLGLLIEPISHAAVPGYYMHGLAQAIALSRRFPDGQILLMLDTFHACANQDDVGAFVASNVDRIGHVHIADHPGRHEPGSGDFAFEAFVAQLKQSGYSGLLGFEYTPRDTTAPGLHWVPAWRKHADRADFHPR
ncbi:TIM barrel protein [Devosia sp. 2618]|uniref:hydroxypyruvate isomerase family protein n=1 Tax=Devosia sp. 2618 TaxID=3156454 RepID=UPI00339842A9